MSNQGWICPRCSSVWAPSVQRCQSLQCSGAGFALPNDRPSGSHWKPGPGYWPTPITGGSVSNGNVHVDAPLAAQKVYSGKAFVGGYAAAPPDNRRVRCPITGRDLGSAD